MGGGCKPKPLVLSLENGHSLLSIQLWGPEKDMLAQSIATTFYNIIKFFFMYCLDFGPRTTAGNALKCPEPL